MMEWIRSWLFSLVAVSMLLSLVQALLPEGGAGKIASLLGGLLMIAVLLGPILKMPCAPRRLPNLTKEDPRRTRRPNTSMTTFTTNDNIRR